MTNETNKTTQYLLITIVIVLVLIGGFLVADRFHLFDTKERKVELVKPEEVDRTISTYKSQGWELDYQSGKSGAYVVRLEFVRTRK